MRTRRLYKTVSSFVNGPLHKVENHWTLCSVTRAFLLSWKVCDYSVVWCRVAGSAMVTRKGFEPVAVGIELVQELRALPQYTVITVRNLCG